MNRLAGDRIATTAGPPLNNFQRTEADNVNSIAAQQLALNNREDLVHNASSVLLGNPAVPVVNGTRQVCLRHRGFLHEKVRNRMLKLSRVAVNY